MSSSSRTSGYFPQQPNFCPGFGATSFTTIAVAPPECGPVRCVRCKALWLRTTCRFVESKTVNVTPLNKR